MCDTKQKKDVYQHKLNILWFSPSDSSLSIWLLWSLFFFLTKVLLFKRRSLWLQVNFFLKKTDVWSFKAIIGWLQAHPDACLSLQMGRTQRNLLRCWRSSSDHLIYLNSIGLLSNICSNISPDFVRLLPKIFWTQDRWLKFLALCCSGPR